MLAAWTADRLAKSAGSSGLSASAARRPTPVGGAHDPTPADVDAHPQGASPFGVQDLCGNVWQYTDEFEDAHTRAVVLRGGSR